MMRSAVVGGAGRDPRIMSHSPSTSSAPPSSFIVLKGYHMGSKWFAEIFSALPGGAFHFEYEHCLRKEARERPDAASTHLVAPASATLSYLRHGCHCASSCLGRCNATENSHIAPCLATGVSFGALGAAYIAHVRAVLHHEPRVAIVAHVRTNHVKHALSFLRTSCDGEYNHAYKVAGRSGTSMTRASRLHVPPPLLLLRAVHAAQENQRILSTAKSVSSDSRGVAHVMVYERLQSHLAAELTTLLVAIGVPRAAANAAVSATAPIEDAKAASEKMVKAGAENLAEGLSNFAEVEAYLSTSRLPCLLSMLRAEGPQSFAVGACDAEVETLSCNEERCSQWKELLAVKAARPRGWALNATECGAPPSG